MENQGRTSESKENAVQTIDAFPTIPRGVALIVLAVAFLVNALSFAASQLWVSPDASYYVELAGGLADRFDLSSQLFLIRPPGYPVFLAVLFRIFGESSPTAILVTQHLMVIGVVYLIALIAWRITQRPWMSLSAGLMAACSLQLIAYANLIMTEVPYTLATVWAVYHLLVFQQTGRSLALALASLLVGVSYTFRPIGMVLLPVCGIVAVVATLQIARSSQLLRRFESAAYGVRTVVLRSLAFRFACAVVPAMVVYLPCRAQNELIHGGDLSSRCADLALYFRIVYMDKLDSTRSEALNDIRRTVDEAADKGLIPADADYRLWGPVWQAYEKSRGVRLAESSRIMGRAARDLIAEHPVGVLDGTIRYSLWMILVPDAFYRFHPDGTPGICDARGECRRDPNAAILASNTYEPMMRPWTHPQAHYLPLRSKATFLTPLWSALSAWFYHNIEKGRSVLGIGDSPFEAFGWLCIMGMLGSLMMPQRGTYLVIIAAVGLQIVVSAFLAGPTPRYAVPVRPLLLLFPAIPASFAIASLRSLFARSPSRFMAWWRPGVAQAGI